MKKYLLHVFSWTLIGIAVTFIILGRIHTNVNVNVECIEATSQCLFELHHTRKFSSNTMQSHNVKLIPFVIVSVGGSGTHTIVEMLNNRGKNLLHEGLTDEGAVGWIFATNDQYKHTKWSQSNTYPPYCDGCEDIWPKWTDKSPRFLSVIHLTRCPIKTISALTTHRMKSYLYIHDTLPAELSDQLMFNSSSNSTIWRAFRDVSKYSNQRRIPNDRIITAISNEVGLYPDDSLKMEILLLAARSYVLWSRHILKYSDSPNIKIESLNAENVCEQLGIGGCSDDVHVTAQSKHYNHRTHQNYQLHDIETLDAKLADEVRFIGRSLGYEDDC